MENQVNNNETTEKKGKCGCQGVCQYKAFFISLLTSIIVVAIYHCIMVYAVRCCPIMRGPAPCPGIKRPCAQQACPQNAPMPCGEKRFRHKREFRPAPGMPCAPESCPVVMVKMHKNPEAAAKVKAPAMPKPDAKPALPPQPPLPQPEAVLPAPAQK